MRLLGRLLMAVGFVVGAFSWVVSTVHFFSSDSNSLGFISLVIPPSALVLPWLVSSTLGIASVVSAGCLAMGALCLSNAEAG